MPSEPTLKNDQPVLQISGKKSQLSNTGEWVFSGYILFAPTKEVIMPIVPTRSFKDPDELMVHVKKEVDALVAHISKSMPVTAVDRTGHANKYNLN